MTGGTRKCYICKKKFSTWYATEGWAYQCSTGKNKHSFCSYNCMRAWERQRDAKRKYRTRDMCWLQNKASAGVEA